MYPPKGAHVYLAFNQSQLLYQTTSLIVMLDILRVECKLLPMIGTISVVVVQRLLECAIPEDEAKCSLASVATEEW